MTRPILIEVAPGELIDKITILEIKAERIADPARLANVRTELEALAEARRAAIPADAGIDALEAELKRVNERLWQIEDEIRDSERAGDFGSRFIELARSVYRTNDRRAELKREINTALGSRLVEEKSYRDY
jgi:post-segregation antitoxin (ccd killing protein)